MNLIETKEDDRFIETIAESLTSFIQQLPNDIKSGKLGTISSLTNTTGTNEYQIRFLLSVVQVQPLQGSRYGEFNPRGQEKYNIPGLEKTKGVEYIRAVYSGFYPAIRISRSLIALSKSNSHMAYSILIHELRHLMDWIKSESHRATDKSQKPRDKTTSKDSYLSTTYEIDARVQQVIADGKKLLQNSSRKLNTNQLLTVIEKLLDKHHILKYFPNGVNDREYRRILKHITTSLEDFT